MAFDEFLDESSDIPVGDIFEEWMDNNGIYYQYIGDIEITFGERQTDYLAEYIPRN